MSYVNAPCCESCWMLTEFTVDEDGEIWLRKPARLTEPELEQCGWCGKPTIFGVYLRADETELAFPPQNEDEDQ